MIWNFSGFTKDLVYITKVKIDTYIFIQGTTA